MKALAREVLAMAASFLVGLTGLASTNADQLDDAGMSKLAEMTALVRHNEDCPAVPQQWLNAYTMLLMTHPPSEQLVEQKETQMLALRDKIGQSKWCQLYSVEMDEAFTVYRVLAGQ